MKLLTPREVDRLFRYPEGRSLALARDGCIRCITLPDGEIRFDADVIAKLLAAQPADTDPPTGKAVAHA